MKTAITQNEFRAIAKEVYPHLNTITQILKDHNLEGHANIALKADGYLDFTLYSSIPDAELIRLPGQKARIDVNYVTVEKLEG